MKKASLHNPKSKPSKSKNATAVKRKVLKAALAKGVIDEKTGLVRAIVETTKGSRNKYSFLPQTDRIVLQSQCHVQRKDGRTAWLERLQYCF